MAKSGSMPVVSQSITRPMVPVGAMTVAWALRKPCAAPSSSAASQAPLAALIRDLSGQLAASSGTGFTERPL